MTLIHRSNPSTFHGVMQIIYSAIYHRGGSCGEKMGVLDGIGMAMVNLSHVSLSWHLVTFVGDESQKGRRNGV